MVRCSACLLVTVVRQCMLGARAGHFLCAACGVLTSSPIRWALHSWRVQLPALPLQRTARMLVARALPPLPLALRSSACRITCCLPATPRRCAPTWGCSGENWVHVCLHVHYWACFCCPPATPRPCVPTWGCSGAHAYVCLCACVCAPCVCGNSPWNLGMRLENLNT